MNDLIVVMAASSVGGTVLEYQRQLTQAGIEWAVFDISDRASLRGGIGNLGDKITEYRQIATKYRDYERLIITDAFDVTFYGTKEDVIRKCPTGFVLFPAEKNCFPDQSIADKVPGVSPWRFFNGGLCASTPKTLLQWCDVIEHHLCYDPEMVDQLFFNDLLTQGSPLVQIDSSTELFFCLYGGYSELTFENGLPLNTLYKTLPNFIHQNGGWPAERFNRMRMDSLIISGHNPTL